MKLVAGVDSSTQSCKVVIRDLDSGKTIRTGSAKHPDGTEIDPQFWFEALLEAISNAGGLEDVDAISIAGQQHGMVVLDEFGKVIRPALLWNDTRSAGSAEDLINEVGRETFIERTGSVPVASFTITKLRWLRDNEPENAAKVHAVALPHDWLTWRLRGFGPLGESEFGPKFEELATDRSDASGTGYFNSRTNEYERGLLITALGHDVFLPKVLGPSEVAGKDAEGRIFGAGAGDNAGAALGLGLHDGDIVVSIGTSGTVFASTTISASDPSGTIAGFADGSGNFLPIAVTLNAARVLKSGTDLLEVDFDEFSNLALSAKPGSSGLVLVPYFEGERTPNLPNAKATLRGMTISNTTRANLARAFIEGMLCGLADGLEALSSLGVRVDRIFMIGGGSQNPAVQEIASTIFPYPIVVPNVSEYVAEGAAVQAAWASTGQKPTWKVSIASEYQPNPSPEIRTQYKIVT